MAVEVWELLGREFRLGERRPEDRVQFAVTGVFNEPDAEAAIRAAVPAFFNNLWLLGVSAREEGFGFWRGTADYGIPTGGTDVPSQLGLPGTSPPPPAPPAPNEALGPEWSFDTAGGTRHITTSFETREKQTGFGFGTTPPDNQRAIGAGKNGVEGCDVVTAKCEFSVSRKMGQLSLNYLRVLVDLTGKTNDDVFLGVFERGEVLFLGASVNYRDNEGWTVVCRFSGSPNKEGNESAASPIDRVSPRGHDYVWVVFADTESNGFKIPVPAAAYVERVYEEGDFDLLGI